MLSAGVMFVYESACVECRFPADKQSDRVLLPAAGDLSTLVCAWLTRVDFAGDFGLPCSLGQK